MPPPGHHMGWFSEYDTLWPHDTPLGTIQQYQFWDDWESYAARD